MSVVHAIGQADSEFLECALLDHKANYFKRSVALIHGKLNSNRSLKFKY